VGLFDDKHVRTIKIAWNAIRACVPTYVYLGAIISVQLQTDGSDLASISNGC